ncbi:uncharacterized protein LOC113850909 [Abrus precatorius]|uniref:Uncharacterized protein LOC113850909 n=1 Tax=Abrus precatorius TaxID=3816 RepID=A0A8B8K2I1_ABRPR|nr:uncharacterized protein LOC113850909 [Abrus precatorius]
MTVGEYTAKFQELMKYWPHYQHGDGEEDLCAQFEHGLRPDIRAAVSVFQLTDLPTLLSKSRIFEANSRGKTVDTRGAGLAAKRSGSASASHRPESRGSSGPSTGQKPSILGRVFAMSGAEASHLEELIRGKCIIKGRLLDVLFDSGATHSFIFVDCVKSLGLYVTELSCNVVVTTPTDKLVVTSWVCLGCAVMVHGRKFEVNLICLPLSQLDVILGMDWLAANHVLLDCREKTLIFGATIAEVPRLMS